MEGVRRGHLKYYVLRLLMEKPLTGYGLMKSIQDETGFWKPSAGSLYPLLGHMKADDLIAEAEDESGSKWRITERGRASYTEGSESKRALLRSMQNSLVVFSKVFDCEPLGAMASRLEAWQEGRGSLRTLGPAFMDLHDALWRLPEMNRRQEAKIKQILEAATQEIEALGPSSDA